MPALTKLLIANRGEIARRVARTARTMGLTVVAVYSDADEGQPFVAEADEAIRLPGSAAIDTYLRADLIVAAAVLAGADCVHPGYGFLSENAAFAQSCADAGLTFVGPSPAVMDLMGSKITAKQLMATAGVPVLPGITVAAGGELAEPIGFPVLVKAAFGGGGRGMRIVRQATDLDAAIAAAQREAAAAFGDGTVFVEKLIEAPRHIEVQVLGDAFGTVVHLFERECSIQRRHQKVIEEAPASGDDEQLRAEICEAAVAAAKAIGYVNAGTVEFVADQDGHFWFLEVNTRLQVEHPVTELVTGLDLVELQLRIAAGEPMPEEALSAVLRGHAIEARLYAEDAAAGFLPTSGTLHRLRIPMLPGMRVDAGYEDGSVVSTHYDAMLAKVVAWAPTRAAAASRLADALAGAEIHGVVTNRDLLVGTLRHSEFLSGDIDTGFYERHDPASLGATRVAGDGDRIHAAVAGLLATEAAPDSPLPAGIPAGWRNVGGGDDPVVLSSGERQWSVVRRAERLWVDGEELHGRVISVASDGAALEVGGIRRSYRVQHAGDTWYVDSALGASALREAPRFPPPASVAVAGSLVAPLPGTVVRVGVAPGDAVEAGQVLLAIEAMKMEHGVRAPHAGTVTDVLVAIGDQVETGMALAIVEASGG